MTTDKVIEFNTQGVYQATLIVRSSFVEMKVLLRTPLKFTLPVTCTPAIDSRKLPFEVLNAIERVIGATSTGIKPPEVIKFNMIFKGLIRFCKLFEQAYSLEGSHLFVAEIAEIHSVEELS